MDAFHKELVFSSSVVTLTQAALLPPFSISFTSFAWEEEVLPVMAG
jgi:hypothetical protein